MQKDILLRKLGDRIRNILIEMGLSQVELANAIGKDQQSIQRLEKGNVNPNFYYLKEISQGFNVEISEL